MPIYTITIEKLNKSGKHDYAGLLKELQAQKCFPLMQHHFLGSFSNSAEQIRDHFKKFLDAGDRIMVSELIMHFAYGNMPSNAAKWIEANPPRQLEEIAKVVSDNAKAKAKAAENPDKPKAAASKKKAKA
jgi:S-methylmethionine-dependent homocysteine/selenocysteine methylase